LDRKGDSKERGVDSTPRLSTCGTESDEGEAWKTWTRWNLPKTGTPAP